MLDIRRVRHEPEEVKRALGRRGGQELPGLVDDVLALDEARRASIGEVNDLKARRNEASKKIGELKRTGGDAEDLIASMRALGDRIGELDEEIRVNEARVEEILMGIPNLPLDEIPDGGAECNRVVSMWGEPRSFGFEPRPHWEIGEALGILDLPRGAKISGSGFPVLRGAGARLQRGLIDWFLDVHTSENGYEELRVPYLVNRESLTGTGQLPKFADELYMAERDGLWLIPTAEVPVTNLLR
ncbi:MAG: serine--tRNA ligase, partial [Proteobacteria bacterium]|nr:serine--tRNA ligase [Pseudomonadota bacterium]